MDEVLPSLAACDHDSAPCGALTGAVVAGGDDAVVPPRTLTSTPTAATATRTTARLP
jgi:hypothetical protein